MTELNEENIAFIYSLCFAPTEQPDDDPIGSPDDIFMSIVRVNDYAFDAFKLDEHRKGINDMAGRIVNHIDDGEGSMITTLHDMQLVNGFEYRLVDILISMSMAINI